jgi:acyl-CoA thioester hydrolase
MRKGFIEALASPPSAVPEEVDRTGFLYTGHVHFDDLDAMGMLHNSRYLVLAERANSAFFEANGWRYETNPELNPDQFYAVREQWVRYLEPVKGPCDLVIEMWVDTLGESSATYAFAVRSADGTRFHAEIRRIQIKLDPKTLRPTPWTPRLRAQVEQLLRPDRL